MACDQRELGERLGVVDECRASAHTALNGIGGVSVGLAGPPLQRFDERRLLAGDVAARDELDRDPRPVAAGVLALGERAGQAPQGAAGGLVDADDQLVGADGAGGEHAAVEHQVGQALEQQAVLGARGLSLGRVREHDRPLAERRRRRRPPPQLPRKRERGAAAAAQTGLLDELDQRAGAAALAARAVRAARRGSPGASANPSAPCSGIPASSRGRPVEAWYPRSARSTGLRGGRCDVAACPSSDAGVPERCAQPCRAARAAARARGTSANAAVAPSAAPRRRACSGQPVMATTPTASADDHAGRRC